MLQHYRPYRYTTIKQKGGRILTTSVLAASLFVAFAGFALPARALNQYCTFDGSDFDLLKRNFWQWIEKGVKRCKNADGTYSRIIRIVFPPTTEADVNVNQIAAAVCDFTKTVAVFPIIYTGYQDRVLSHQIVVCMLQTDALP